MIPFHSFHFPTIHNGKERTYIVSFNRLRKTEERKKWFPISAISAISAKVREESEPDANCSNCGFGISYRHHSDDLDLIRGMKIALARSLVHFPKEVRADAWVAFLRRVKRENERTIIL